MKREDNAMKINICKKEVEERKLCEVIQKYEELNNNTRKADIFMSKDTADSLSELNINEFFDCKVHEGMFGQFESNTIFINNNLPFGEVEIR